jgi:hypothetical protein
MKKLLFAFMMAVVLGGCAAAMQRNADDLNAQMTKRLKSDPALAIIATKIPLDGVDKATIAQMADTSYANEEEKKALLVLDAIQNEYTDRFLKEVASSGHPVGYAINQEFFSAAKNILLSLYQGKITFGESVQQSKKAYEIQVQMVSRLNAYSADQARRAFGEALTSYQASQPIRTNCTSFGGSTNCVTR